MSANLEGVRRRSEQGAPCDGRGTVALEPPSPQVAEWGEGWLTDCISNGVAPMRSSRTLIVGALIAGAGAAALWWRSGPDASQFAHLREPRLTRLGDQRVLVVEAEGDPNVVGTSAFGQLFRTSFALDGVSRMGRPPAPRARWPRPQDTPKDRWLGQYALPVPDAVAAPPIQSKGPLKVVVTTWAYGDVAEVLHVGPYSAEPGMLFAGDPEQYLTIIRLRVEKASAVGAVPAGHG